MVASSTLWIFLSTLNMASTALVGYFESENCVDPKGMESCYQKAESARGKCNDNEEFDKCFLAFTQDQVSCTATHCWNQVYTCEYQLLVEGLLDFLDKSTFKGIPFYPPPENAAVSCNCNFSKIASSFLDVWTAAKGCGENIDNELEDEVLEACVCCDISGILSA